MTSHSAEARLRHIVPCRYANTAGDPPPIGEAGCSCRGFPACDDDPGAWRRHYFAPTETTCWCGALARPQTDAAEVTLFQPATPPTPEGPQAGLDIERLSIAMNRAYTYGTGTAEEVAEHYAGLAQEVAEEDRG